jgi:competence ComEA-like helix-hairpin-helix protein
MCHNKLIDHEFAYVPTPRFFWKKTKRRVPVDVGSCAEAQYSPAGAATPGTLSLCRKRTLGRKIRIAGGATFSPLAANTHAQGSAVVVIANDRISWVGAGTECAGHTTQTPEEVEAVVYECVQEICPHPLCCDCGSDVCTKGHAEATCRKHTAPRSLWTPPTTTTTTMAPASTTAPTAPVMKIDINAANPMELAHIYGIGPVLAVRIAAYRLENGPFADVAALNQVKGIGSIMVQEMATHAGGKHALPIVAQPAVTATP